jgi:diguanylate cyclase (GGDEF)-like protein
MDPFRLHRMKFIALLLLALAGAGLHLVYGQVKPAADWNALDIAAEGGSALLVLSWAYLLLKSRPRGHVTSLLFAGLGCLFFALGMDGMDEFVRLPEAIVWDTWLESMPLPAGFLLLTLGIYHLHREQLALSAQMGKREKLFRDYRLLDTLTSLGDGDYLRWQIEAELNRARGAMPALSLVLIDVHDFARLNRRHGQAEGDRVLQAVTQLLLLNLRAQDLLCRFAGDRFVILLPQTDASAASEMANEYVASIRQLAWRDAAGERVYLDARAAVETAGQDSAASLLARLQTRLADRKRATQPTGESRGATAGMAAPLEGQPCP